MSDLRAGQVFRPFLFLALVTALCGMSNAQASPANDTPTIHPAALRAQGSAAIPGARKTVDADDPLSRILATRAALGDITPEHIHNLMKEARKQRDQEGHNSDDPSFPR